jgi:hypothetical protein
MTEEFIKATPERFGSPLRVLVQRCVFCFGLQDVHCAQGPRVDRWISVIAEVDLGFHDLAQ